MSVLLVDGASERRALLKFALENEGVDVLATLKLRDVYDFLEDGSVSLVVVESQLESGGCRLVDIVRTSHPNMPVVLLSSSESFDTSFDDLDSLVFFDPIDPENFAHQIVELLPQLDSPPAAQDDYESQMSELRRRFADSLPGKLNALSEAIVAAQVNPDFLVDARSLAHRLHGSAGSYGFAAVGQSAGELEDLMGKAIEHRQVISQRHFWSDVRSALQDVRISAARAPELESVSSIRLLPGRALLIVGHDPAFLALAKSAARNLKLDVIAARTETEALQHAKTRRFMAVVLDVHLEHGANAFALAKEIRKTENADTPLAFISADGRIETRVAAIEAGASKFFEKPISADGFSVALENFVVVSELDLGRILIVEDDLDTRELYAATLEKAGYSVDTMGSADGLIERLNDAKSDLLLLDVNLPGVSGIDVCRAMRFSDRWGLLPVVIITSDTERETRVAAFRAGASDVISKPVLAEELLARVQSQMERLTLVRERADKDALSGVMTRRAFLENFQRDLARCQRDREPLSVVFLDLDHFKEVNDVRGHLAGDFVLAKLGELMRQRFRIEDLSGRWGGEEFVIAFPGQEREFATFAATNLLDEFADQVFVAEDGEHYNVTFTAGVAGFPDDGLSTQALIHCADERLYVGKQSGRNRVVGAGSLSEVSEIWDLEEVT